MALTKNEEIALGVGTLAALGVLYVVGQKPAQAATPPALPPPPKPQLPGLPAVPALPGFPSMTTATGDLTGPDGIARVYWTDASQQAILTALGKLAPETPSVDSTGGSDGTMLTTIPLAPLPSGSSLDAASAAIAAAKAGSIVWADPIAGVLLFSPSRDAVLSRVANDNPQGSVLPILLDAAVMV